MKASRILTPLASLTLGAAAFAGEHGSDSHLPCRTPLDDSGAAQGPHGLGFEADIGINGVVSAIDASPDNVIQRIDMAASLRGEASKGRFGIMGDFFYVSLSDGIGTDTLIKKVDIQVDQIIGELALRWRLIDSPRGSLDVYAGLRYTNLFQEVTTHPDSERIGEASRAFVDAVSGRLREALTERLQERLSEHDVRNLVRDRLLEETSGRVPTIDPDRPTHLPIGPLGGRLADELRARITAIIEAKQAELAAAIRQRTQAARAAVGARAEAARARAQQRIDEIKRDLSRKIARALESKLDARFARTDDWWDPFIGLRGRLNLGEAWYLTAKGDVGGFGVGSDFTWQAEAALGCQITGYIFAEAGYRALGTDYEGDGLTTIYTTAPGDAGHRVLAAPAICR